MPNEQRTPVGVLLGAARMVETLGLSRGCLIDDEGQVCAVRALQAQLLGHAILVPWWEDERTAMPVAYSSALRLIGLTRGWTGWQHNLALEGMVMVWSDGVMNGPPSVVNCLRRAADLGSQLRHKVGA